jgi:hypothetical protein
LDRNDCSKQLVQLPALNEQVLQTGSQREQILAPCKLYEEYSPVDASQIGLQV